MIIAGITIRNSQVKSLDSRSPSKEQYRQTSISGINKEAITISYTHNYILNLHSLSREEYIALYNALLTLDQTDDSKVTITATGEIREGLVHIPRGDNIPATIDFDFDITSINPQPGIFYNMSLPLSIYVAV